MNTRQKTYILIAILLVIGSGGATYFIKDRNNSSNRSGQKEAVKISKVACELFTEKDAQKLLGNGVEKATTTTTASEKTSDQKDIPPPAPEIKTPESQAGQQTDQITSSAFDRGSANATKNSTSIDNACVYLREAQMPIYITLLPMESKDAKKNFEVMKVSDAKEISGYNGEAYWRTGKDSAGKEYGQLGILEPGGVVTVAGDPNDLDVLKKIADVIEGNLND